MTAQQQPEPERSGFPADFGRAAAELLQGHENLASRRGITREQLDGLFDLCYERYLGGDYEGASQGFELLCIYDHGNLKNLQGYGYSLMALKNYHKAAICLYFSTLLMERGSGAWGEVCLTVAGLFAQVGQKKEAQKILQAVLDELPDAAVQERASALSKALGNG